VQTRMNFESTTVQGQTISTSMLEDMVIVTPDEA
jgi:hypothetical protein